MTTKTWKNRPQKLLIIGPNLFFHSPAQLTAHSPELIFQIINMSQDSSVSLSVVNEGASVATAVTLQITPSTGCPVRDWRSLKTFSPYENELFSKIPLLICNWIRFDSLMKRHFCILHLKVFHEVLGRLSKGFLKKV